MSVQQAIDNLANLCNQAGSQAELREVARVAYVIAQMNQAAMSAVVSVLNASGVLPAGVWERALEAAYINQAEVLRAASSQIIMAPNGKA